MNSTITLTRPYVNLSSIRAISIRQMYSITPQFIDLTWEYAIGLPITQTPSEYTITNLTMNAKLIVTMSPPEMGVVDIPVLFGLLPGGQVTFTLRMSEVVARERSTSVRREYHEVFSIQVQPVDFVGPIFIRDR